MKYRIFSTRCDAMPRALLGILVLANGCVSAPDEGAYVDPPGFSPQHTGRAALSPGAFMRVGDGIVTRNQLGRAAGPSVTSRVAGAGEELELEARFLGSYADGVRVALAGRPKAYVDVVPVGARAVGARVRQDGALVAFEGAYPEVSAAFGADPYKVEEFLAIPTAASVPKLRYRLVPGPDFGSWSNDGSSLWGYARDGAALFQLVPPVVVDAVGKAVAGNWRVVEESAGAVSIEPVVSFEGLSFPVLFDPTFTTPTWFPATVPVEPAARSEAAGAFYPDAHNCTVIFGGLGAGGALRNDVVARCDGHWLVGADGSGIPPSSAQRPVARLGASMAYAPFGNGRAGMYMFGGYASGGISSELWRLTLSGGAEKQIAWERVPEPPLGSTVPWPKYRFYPHLAWTGAELLLYGGVGLGTELYKDVWRYDGTSWSLVCENCYPGRYFSAQASLGDVMGAPEIYDFGGYGPAVPGGSYSRELLKFDGTTWQTVSLRDAPVPTLDDGQVNPSGDVVPTPRVGGFAARTNLNQLLVGTGGNGDPCGTGRSVMSDAWLWNRTGGENRWLRVASEADSMAPGLRIGATAVYDPFRNETLIFGGLPDCSDPQTVVGNGVLYRERSGSVTMTVRCEDPDLNGGANGNACDKYVLDARVSGIAGDSSPTRARTIFLRLRGSQWVEVGGPCGSNALPMSPTGPNTFRCDVTPFVDGAIDTGFAVEVRDSAYYSSGGGGAGCSPTGSGGLPYCNGASAYAGVAACINGTASALPVGHLTSSRCNL